MDPLSALAIATGVVTFVDFAGSLISTGKQLYRSANGSSLENLQVERVYSRLLELSGKLAGPLQPVELFSVVQTLPSISVDFSAIEELSALCHADCQALLDCLQNLNMKTRDRRLWRCVKAAFCEALGRAKIEDLENRLRRTQSAISLHISSILSTQIYGLQLAINDLMDQNRRLSFHGESRIDHLSQTLRDLSLNSTKLGDSIPKVDQLEAWREQIAVLLSTHQAISRDQAILSSLNFESRPVRHASIPTAYQETFKWIYEGAFREWLEHGSGVFWISGRAGSGKSTLMKFIADHTRTQNALIKWAAPSTPTIAAHYFWNPGTSLQRSQQGLLQTLLFEIFKSCPLAMSSVRQSRWELTDNPSSRAQTADWSIEELSETLQCLSQRDDLPMKLCVFVDGMDEFQGNHLELCQNLLSLAQSPHIKLCLSSRPWEVFELNFGQDPAKKLYVHDLTRDDILTFTKGRLQSHPMWNRSKVGELDKDSFIETIWERAGGVFLWVYLVTQSLRDGLTNRDTIRDLKRRLDSLPTDLERLFDHIIQRIDPIYHETASENLLLAYHATEPLNLELFSYHDEEVEDRSYALDWPIEEQRKEDLTALRKAMLCRLNARSGGLLEAPDFVTVQFLHRTVRDFLGTQKMKHNLGAKTRQQFDVNYSLTSAYIVAIKSTTGPNYTAKINPKPGSYFGDICDLIHHALESASKLPRRYWHEGIQLLDELERALGMMEETGQLALSNLDVALFFRDLHVQYVLAWYLEHKLAESATYLQPFREARNSPLFAALLSQTPSVDVVKKLLEYGEDINSSYCHQMSPWVWFCRETFETQGTRQSSDFPRTIGLLKLLLQRGSRPNDIPEWNNVELGKTVFQGFLNWMLCFAAADESVLDVSLEALDSFIEAGAELGPDEWRIICRQRRGSVGRQVRMSSVVTKRIISKCAQEELAHLRAWITRDFPAYTARTLIGMIATRLGCHITLQGGQRKRTRADHIDQESSVKRAKTR